MALGYLQGLRQPYNTLGNQSFGGSTTTGLRDMISPMTNNQPQGFGAMPSMAMNSVASPLSGGAFDFNSLVGNQSFMSLPDEQKLKLLQMMLGTPMPEQQNLRPRSQSVVSSGLRGSVPLFGGF